MTPKRWLCGIVVFFVAAATACLDLAGPFTPDLPDRHPVTPSNPVSPPPQPPPVPPPFPAVPNTATIYQGPDNLYDFASAYHGSSVPSRYVFFADSTFRLQMASYRFGILQTGGHYSRTDSLFFFNWEGWNIAGDWGGGAILRGDTLHVRYNDIMKQSDFVDGRYILVR